MRAPLLDDVWTRRGINVLWDGDALARMGAASKVISLRGLFELDAAGWPDEQVPLVDDAALVVAGLDAAIDAAVSSKLAGTGSDLNAVQSDVEAWLEQSLYPRIQEFQSVFAGDAALIFWMADQSRWVENSGEGCFEWRIGSGSHGPTLPLARLLWDGAYQDVRRIEEEASKGGNRWIGLYLARIS